jgi:hypothetical protein
VNCTFRDICDLPSCESCNCDESEREKLISDLKKQAEKFGLCACAYLQKKYKVSKKDFHNKACESLKCFSECSKVFGDK